MLYMLDTSTISYMARGCAPIRRHMEAILSEDSVCMSVITQAELKFGLRKNPQSKYTVFVNQIWDFIRVLDWTHKRSDAYAILRADCEQAGRTPGALDLLIASHALTVGATLISSDTRLLELTALRVEDWNR